MGSSKMMQFLLVLVSGVLVAAATAWGQTVWYVDDDYCPGPGSGTPEDPFCKIQDGIDASINGDTVQVADATYTGTGNRDLDFGGKLITVRSENGPDNCIIDCERNGRGFYFHSGETAEAVVDGFTIQHGSVWDSPGGAYGGGMYNEGSSPTVTNCTFGGNWAEWQGGGMYNDEGTSPTVTNCTFTDNEAHMMDGGGMYNNWYSSPTVTDCTFTGNSASYGAGMRNNHTFDGPTVTNCTFTGNSGVYGGGMENGHSSPTVTNCTFSGNWAEHWGGGMGNWSGSSPTVTNCTFSGNTAADWGGGMANPSSSSSPTVTNCTFSGNTGSLGGGINNHGSPTVSNCTFSGNSAGDWGGGMYNQYGTPTVSNCTFSGNSAANSGGGMCCYRESAPGPDVTLLNCVLWEDSAPVGPEIALIENSTVTISYSDVQGGQGSAYVCHSGCTLDWGLGMIDADPLFVGGPASTWTADGVYDSEAHQVTFSDASAAWSANELAGKLVNPDTTQPLQLPIVGNTNNTMTVWGDWATIVAGASWVTTGMSYQVYDYHVTAGSPCIHAGHPFFVPDPGETDLDGHARVLCDRVDMGAYEFGIGDYNCDQVVDLDDFGNWPVCMTGPDAGPYGEGCEAFDFDYDGDVDLFDFAEFQAAFTAQL